MADEITNYREKENEEEQYEAESDVEFNPQMLVGWVQVRLDPDLQQLYRTAMAGKWETAKLIIDKDENAKTKIISLFGFTALHVAASCGRSEFVVDLVQILTPQELEIRDQVGRTALHHAALASNVRAAKAMVEKNRLLPQIGDMDLRTPLLYAAQSKRKEMLEYLCQVTKDELPCNAFTGLSASNLIVAITASGSHDIALSILERYPTLAYRKNDEGTSILHVLAMQPSAFRSGNKFSLWKTFQWIRKASEVKRSHLDAVKLVKFVCGELQQKSIDLILGFFISKEDTAILHLAIEHGNLELIQMCIKYFPDLIWYANNKGRLLLHVAIEQRQTEIFNYIIKLIGKNSTTHAELIDEDHNNSLHLAAKLAPPHRLQSVPGPAFQMRGEVQWFKAVEALVNYETRMTRNEHGETPRELFIQEHAVLLRDAKDWMKDTSNSSMVVAALVGAVAFAAMITVPGGNDTTGIPTLSRKKLFIAFSISNALSMISSAISLLMFLSIQTSRYTDKDFLNLLPKILVNGLTFLLIAVATMMISFGAAIGLSLQKRFNWAYIPVTVVACWPVIIFYNLQAPLLLHMLPFTSGPGIFQGRRDRLFRNLNP